MTLRLLLALALTATGAGIGASSAAAGTTASGASQSLTTTTATTTNTTEASDGIDPGLSVEKADLVVQTTDEATAADPSATTTTTPTDAPTASDEPTASDAPTAADAPATAGAPQDDGADPVDPDAAPADTTTLDPAVDDVVADLLTDDRVVTAPVEADDKQTIGVTWPDGADISSLDPQVRTFIDGEWSQWQAMEVSDEAPDEGTADAESAVRGGTDSFWIGDAEAVQLSFAAVDSAAPSDMDVTLVGSQAIDPEVATAQDASFSGDATFSTLESTDSGATVTAATQPAVITRAQWGARAEACTPDVASSLVGAVVHHTAGSNSYTTVAQAMQQIRNDQAYHIDSRGWCDIGYNFIVDKWGNIYEGRANSLTQAVIGVHAGGFNTGTVGVAMLGTYSSQPSDATQQAVGKIIGWRLAAYGIDPTGWMSYATGNGQNSRYKNQTVSLPTVFGHRDVAYTACPGDGGHAVLQNIRNYAYANAQTVPIAEAQAVVSALYEDMLDRAVDSSGLSTWSTQLSLGSQTASSLVRTLTASTEYRRLRVTQAYEQVLGREPEAAGMASWLQRIAAGGATVDDVRVQFYASEEYYNRSGKTDSGYVELLYQTALGRDGSASEISHWASQIATVGRAGVVHGIWYSTEAARQRAGGYYSVFLDREPDAAGLATWSGVLLTQGEGAVREGIAGSVEYWNLAVANYT